MTVRTAEWFGTEPAQLRGRRLTEFVAARDEARVRDAVAAVRRESVTQRQSCRLTRAETRVPVEIELLPACERRDDSVVGTVRPANEPRTETGIPTEQARFRHLLDLLDDPAVEVELDGTEPIVRSVNEAFETVFGYRADRMAGKSLNEYIIPDEQGGQAASFDERTADGKLNLELVTRQTATGPQKFHYRGIPYDGPDGTRYGIAIYRDVQDRRRDRKHLKVLRRVLRHNLRNELTVVLGNAEEILDRSASEPVEQAADRIVNRARKLVEISDNSRIVEDALTGSDPATETEIEALINTTVETARETHSTARISADIDEMNSVTVPAEIRDVVEQLLDNAVRHNVGVPSVRVTLRQDAPIHATTRVSAADQYIVIIVSDDGPGIPAHELGAVFHDDEITQLSHGTGLGLWMVRWVVESANGRVAYHRADGWTNVEIRLPVGTDEPGSKLPVD